MRTSEVKILGEVHMLCLSTRAKLDIDERFGGMEKAFDLLKDENQRTVLETTFGLLEIMMRSGAVYAKHMGVETAEPLTADDLFDLVEVSELPDLVIALRDTIVNGVKREVEVESPKNSKATPTKK